LGAALVAVPVDSEARPSVPDAATGVAEEGSETVVWDDPLLGRSAVHTPPPQIPAGATMRGACEVVVEFELQPSGLLRDVVVRVGSGATNLDAAVVETMGEWQFTAAPVASTVRGRVTFICQVSG
jgi:TonB family protein